jgi:hypothetical protein
MATSPNYPASAHRAETGARGGTPGKAVAALVLGVLAIPGILIPLLGFVLGALALGLGLAARAQIRREGMSGGGQAMAGVILGIVAIVLSVAIVVAAVATA